MSLLFYHTDVATKLGESIRTFLTLTFLHEIRDLGGETARNQAKIQTSEGGLTCLSTGLPVPGSPVQGLVVPAAVARVVAPGAGFGAQAAAHPAEPRPGPELEAHKFSRLRRGLFSGWLM